jgi:hypothetical protein
MSLVSLGEGFEGIKNLYQLEKYVENTKNLEKQVNKERDKLIPIAFEKIENERIEMVKFYQEVQELAHFASLALEKKEQG